MSQPTMKDALAALEQLSAQYAQAIAALKKINVKLPTTAFRATTEEQRTAWRLAKQAQLKRRASIKTSKVSKPPAKKAKSSEKKTPKRPKVSKILPAPTTPAQALAQGVKNNKTLPPALAQPRVEEKKLEA